MTSRVGTIIRCADLVRHVYATLESVGRQTLAGGEIVLVIDESTPAAARDWLTALARSRGHQLVNAPSSTPGATRNAGIRATQSPYVVCVDAGDLLDPRAHEIGCEKLAGDPDADVVTSWIQLMGLGPNRRIVAAPGCDLDALVSDTEAIHGASMFRRDAWAAVNGFDETLASLDDYDFWLRVLHAGRRAILVDHPLLIRANFADALHQRARDRKRRAGAMTRVVEKHPALFAGAPPIALYARRQLQELREGNRRLVARRQAALEELEALKARNRDLRHALPPPDGIDFAELKRTTPLSRDWGFDRGAPVDRRYIESFLERHASDIRGTVLEVLGSDYTKRFGGTRVTRSDVLDVDASNGRANLVSDLRSAANIPSGSYDCVILTQTLHLIDDMQSAIAECARILKSDGILLATLPCASRVSLEYGDEADFWRVTEAGARRLFSQIFAPDALEVESHGNVLVNAAFLYGLSADEVTPAEFEAVDPYFPLIVTVRAAKTAAAARSTSSLRLARARGATILLYHRVSSPTTDVHGLSVSPQEFRRQMTHVRDHCVPMPLQALVAAMRDRSMPDGGIAVTFDDGYADNHAEASAILSELGVPATFFLTTDRLDEDFEYWWDTLERILLLPEASLPPDLRIDLPGGQRACETATPDQRLAAHWIIYRAIVGSPAAERDAVIEALKKWSGLGTPAIPANRRMTSLEIRELGARDGHTIGAHSVHHLMLPRQPLDAQRVEITECRLTLEALIERRVSQFAYPFGAFSEETVEAVRDSGWDAAVTCEADMLTPGGDPLRLPRLEVTREAAVDFGDWLERRLLPLSGRPASRRLEV